jgi:hypothetical protein
MAITFQIPQAFAGSTFPCFFAGFMHTLSYFYHLRFSRPSPAIPEAWRSP